MSDDIIYTVRNHYYCPRCEANWSDLWNCGVDDECPECGTECSPDDDEQEILPQDVPGLLVDFQASFDIEGKYQPGGPIGLDDVQATLSAMQVLVSDLIEAARAAEPMVALWETASDATLARFKLDRNTIAALRQKLQGAIANCTG